MQPLTDMSLCRAAIAKLRQDNAKLHEELLLENKFSVTPTSSNLSANIANLQDQSDVYTRKARVLTAIPVRAAMLGKACLLLICLCL